MPAIEPLVVCQVPIPAAMVLSLWKDGDLPAALAEDAARYVQADSPRA